MTLPSLRFEALHRLRVFPDNGGPPGPLTLVHAPTGSGKSTMVTQWVASAVFRDTRICWVRCLGNGGHDETDEKLDQSRLGLGFWRLVREALEAGGDGEVATTAPQIRGGRWELSDREAVERAVGVLAEPTMLVLDDYQHVTQPQLDLDVTALLSMNSLLSVTVISPRYSVLDGPLVTSQLPTMHIETEALAFTRDEVRELAALRGIDPELVPDFVWDLTQGWPVAVSLALGELRAGATARIIETMLGRFASQHLEILGMPGAKRFFYLIVLCEDISRELLAVESDTSPEENRILVQKLKDIGLIRRSWFASGARYRCHPGFARFFREAAVSEFGEEAANRLQRVHALNLSPDKPDAAIATLIELGEYTAASELLITNFLIVMDPSARFFAAVHRIPTSEIKNFPMISGALLLRSMADPSAAPAALVRMHAQLRESVLKEIASGSSGTMVALLTVLIFAERLRGAGPETLRLARDLEQRIERIEDGSLAPLQQTMSFIHAVIGLAALVNGDLPLAERSFQNVLRAADYCQNDSERVRAWNGLTLVSVMNGDFIEGRERLRHSERIMRNAGVRGPQLSWLNLEAARALLAIEDLDEAELRSVLEPVEPILDRIEIAPVFVYAEALLIRGLHGDHAALEALRRRTPQMNVAFQSAPYLVAELAALRVNLTIFVGGYEGASRMLRKLPKAHPAVSIAAVRLSLFQGELSQAKEGALALLEKELPKRIAVETSLIAAVAAWELGEVHAAIELLTPALEANYGFGLSRLFAGVPHESLLALAQTALKHSGENFDEREERGYSNLLSIVQKLPESLRPTRFDQLSPAELRTLQELDSDRTTGQIAEALFVSQNTVKFHLRGIYRKLRVSSRAEALLRASDQGLLFAAYKE